MRISRLKIRNFRGIKNTELLIPSHAVFVGDNNVGKSTVLEAIDLVLGPERLSRRPVIDEHDFYAGCYIDANNESISVQIEAVVSDLNPEQEKHFKDHIEWWDDELKELLDGPSPEKTDGSEVSAALRVGFNGYYDPEEDDFVGSTTFLSPVDDQGNYASFKSSDKRLCGFLYLRTLRTGSRALSLERGSLLDIILRLQDDMSLKIWEEVLQELRGLSVAENADLGISGILQKVQSAIRDFMPIDSAKSPQIKVSDLTRDMLRRTLTVFMASGATREDGNEYFAPFQHQGTGTINTLVLSLLSIIAELKQNVIFAMEEPEIAIPPHTQKSIVARVTNKSSQALFTSHSPYVLEEFVPEQVLVLTRNDGLLFGVPVSLPPTIKNKDYRDEFRKRFCEALLSRKVLILEGRTEYDAYPAVARHLAQCHPDEFCSLEALGFAVINAKTETQISSLGKYFKSLGKTVFVICDRQSPENSQEIKSSVDSLFESSSKGFEDVLINSSKVALKRYAMELVREDNWPEHLDKREPTEQMNDEDLSDVLRKFFIKGKGDGRAADFLTTCAKDEMPFEIIETLKGIKYRIESKKEDLCTAAHKEDVA